MIQTEVKQLSVKVFAELGPEPYQQADGLSTHDRPEAPPTEAHAACGVRPPAGTFVWRGGCWLSPIQTGVGHKQSLSLAASAQLKTTAIVWRLLPTEIYRFQ